MPKPIETGTDMDVIAQDTGKATRKPLGGWEEKPVDKGVFYARPGVYFPMNPTDEEKEVVRGRGVGRGVILENWRRIVDTWNDWTMHGTSDWPVLKVANVSRFCGAKSSISRAKDDDGRWTYNRASGDHLASPPQPCYGEWVTREVTMSFNPMPKRHGMYSDGRRAKLRYIGGPDPFSNELAEESTPYEKALLSPEARELILMNQEMMEQPDGDYADYEMEPHY